MFYRLAVIIVLCGRRVLFHSEAFLLNSGFRSTQSSRLPNDPNARDGSVLRRHTLRLHGRRIQDEAASVSGWLKKDGSKPTVLELAKQMQKTPNQALTAARRVGFTLPETTLLINALNLLNGQASPYHEWSQCEQLAAVLARGGELEPPETVRQAHRQAVIHAASLVTGQGSQGEGGDDCLFSMPGVDEISAGSVCRQGVAELRECSVEELLKTSLGVPAEGGMLLTIICQCHCCCCCCNCYCC